MPVRAAVTLVATAVGVILLVSFRTPPSALPSAAVAPSSTSTSASPTATTTPSGAPPSGGTSPTPTATPTPAASGLRSGTFTGQTYSDQYGNLQVQVVISGGRITDVKVVQSPNDNPQSAYIASVAMPLLRQEVLQAQSAQINILSGATYDSQSYAPSVQSALDLAHA